jgi:hypothetical protein
MAMVNKTNKQVKYKQQAIFFAEGSHIITDHLFVVLGLHLVGH